MILMPAGTTGPRPLFKFILLIFSLSLSVYYDMPRVLNFSSREPLNKLLFLCHVPSASEIRCCEEVPILGGMSYAQRERL